MALVQKAIEYGPRWALKNLMKTYSSLSIEQVVRYIDLASEDVAKGMIDEMVRFPLSILRFLCIFLKI